MPKPKFLRLLLRLAACAWAAPNTVMGCAVGLVIILFGGTVQLHRGVLEFAGGAIGLRASRCRFCAITLGHTIVGFDHAQLARVRAHEQVHVRQYERWGPLFVPAYLLSSLFQWLRGGRPYRDNRFEREAYGQGGD